LVVPMSRAAVAAGADGLLVEVHPNPPDAYSDGEQSISPEEFQTLIRQIQPIASAVGRIVKGGRK
jgi:3-deoxy-7-phosphoheptulonate synthase